MADDQHYIATMTSALTGLLSKARLLVETYDGRPLDHSKAILELPLNSPHDAIVTAWTLAGQLLEYSAEHVSGFVKLVTPPTEVMVCCTCVRSMLETSALASWFLDPSIDGKERISRLYAYRYESMEQSLKFGRAVNRPLAEIADAETRMDQVEQQALSQGYTPVLSRKNNRIGIGQIMPSATDLIDAVLNEGVSYRMLSAVAHGQHWAIRELGFTIKEQDVQFYGTSCATLEKTGKIESLALLGSIVLRAFARPLWSQFQYFGWDELKLEEVLEDTADQMMLSNPPRFWRTT